MTVTKNYKIITFWLTKDTFRAKIAESGVASRK